MEYKNTDFSMTTNLAFVGSFLLHNSTHNSTIYGAIDT